MRRTMLTVALATGLLLSGCGGGDDESTSTAGSGDTAGPSTSEKEKSLKAAADGYYAALIKGNVLGMSAYYPKECEDEAGGLMFGQEMMKSMFEGVTGIHATKVKVEGDRGEILDGKIEGKVSDATQRLFDEDDSDDDPDVWQYKNGKWYTTCDATFGTSSPAPESSP